MTQTLLLAALLFSDDPVPLPLTVEATAYCLRGRTCTGVPAGPGVIAVDPRVIPLGSRLVVQGYGPGRALDTGRAIRGNRIDVWISSPGACRRWGRRRVKVWIRVTTPPVLRCGGIDNSP